MPIKLKKLEELTTSQAHEIVDIVKRRNKVYSLVLCVETERGVEVFHTENYIRDIWFLTTYLSEYLKYNYINFEDYE